MPWHEESPMTLRHQFVRDARRKITPITELCAAYGISRKTGYKWLARYDGGGGPALADRSRRPRTSPTAIAPDFVQALLTARAHHPTWGPRKLLRLVRHHWPTAAWPARSTIALHLQRAGCVVSPRRVRRPGHAGPPQAPMDAPNAIWTADFKGQFRLGDGSLCSPLTIADGYSRLLLSCHALTSTQIAESRPVFVRAFREYGLPLPTRIRADNGVPFATQALERLSARSVGGSASAFSPILSSRHPRIRMAAMNACTGRSNANAPDHRTTRAGPNNIALTSGVANSTTSACTKPSTTPLPLPATRHRPAPIPRASRRSSTPATTKSGGSVITAGSAGTSNGSTSVRHSAANTLAWSRSTTGNGMPTSARSASAVSTNVRSTSRMHSVATIGDALKKCYLCPWTVLLPMSLTAHATGTENATLAPGDS